MSTETDEVGQTALLDLSHKKFNPYWVDEKQEGIIPKNPLHFKAHKLQILLARLEKQAASNPAQFNSKNYIDALNEWSRIIEKINKGETTDVQTNDTGAVGPVPNPRSAPMGAGAPASVGNGVSPQNPFSR